MSNEVVVSQEAHVRPEDAGRIAGAQSVDDKIDTLLKQKEAEANLSGDGAGWRWYATMALSFIIGALFSGFSLPSGGGGASDPVTVGMVGAMDLAAPAMEVVLVGL